MATDGRVSFDAIADHDDLIAWSKRYCERAVRVHGFEVDLDLVEWTVSTRARRRSAAVKYPDFDGAVAGEPYDWDDGPPTCTMALTWGAYDEFSRGEWRSTLRHELIHVEQFQHCGTAGHGPDFYERADEVDAPRSCPSFSEPNYVVRCGDCGDVVAQRFRASRLVKEPEAYRSSCCEAPLSAEST